MRDADVVMYIFNQVIVAEKSLDLNALLCLDLLGKHCTNAAVTEQLFQKAF